MEWYPANREKILERNRKRIKTPEQKEKHLISSRMYYEKKRLTRPVKIKPPRQLKIKFTRIKYTEEKRLQRVKMQDHNKYLKRKPLIQEQNKINRLIINKKYLERTNKRFKEDPLFKLSRDIPKLIRNGIKRNGYSKKTRTYNILGCSYSELKKYLESKFETWMNWDNRGKYNGQLYYGWDLDHVIPVSSAKTEEELLRLNHYTNLQPLDSYINRYIKRNNVA